MSEPGFLETAINAINDLFGIFDIDGTVLGYNEAVKSVSGYSDEELMMKPLGILISPDEERPRVREFFRRSLRGDTSKLETRLLCRDGGEIPVEWRLTPLRDREGSVIGAIIVGRDLTERIEAEKVLKEKEAYFRALTEGSADMIEILGPENAIEYISPSAERILGYRPDELIGKAGSELTHPDDLETIRATITRIYETGTPGAVTIRIRHKDGSWRTCEAVGSRLPGSPDKRRLVVNIRDITERVRMEEALRIAQYELDNTLDLILRIASDGRIVYSNGTARKLLRDSSIDLAHGFIWEILPQVSEGDWPDFWRKRAESFPAQSEVEFYLDDGSRLSLDLAGEILGFEGKDYLVIIGRDISRRKSIEDQLTRANRDLEMIARTVTHDIMAPLSAINITSERLDECLQPGSVEQQPELLREMVDTIREGVMDAIGISTEIASLLHIGSASSMIESVNISGVVNRVMAQLSSEIETRGVGLQVDEDLGVVVANPTHIYQLFANLISNAVKYGVSTHPVVKVARLGEKASGAHSYLVRDNGPGISREWIDYVFHPFFRGETGGTGIGLATAQKVVELYGGNIDARNDGGACFTFTLYDALQPGVQG